MEFRARDTYEGKPFTGVGKLRRLLHRLGNPKAVDRRVELEVDLVEDHHLVAAERHVELDAELLARQSPKL